jgi:hypothetical protein
MLTVLHAERFPISERTLGTKQGSKTLTLTLKLNAKAKGIPASLSLVNVWFKRKWWLDVDQMGLFCVLPLDRDKNFEYYFSQARLGGG